ncbi:MAG: hypothetical protein ACYCOR_10870 [Acidobacteriaceae bacterium]
MSVVKAYDASLGSDAYFTVPFGKVVENQDGTVTVTGKPTSDSLDFDDQIVDKDFAKKALPKWFNAWGNIREMHGPTAIGRAKDLQWDDETDEPLLTVKIVDPTAVKKVREGVLQAFSIGVAHPKFKADPKAKRGRMIDGEIMEVSAVDRPADPDCKFMIVKHVSPTDWLDCQSGFVLTTKAVGTDEEMMEEMERNGGGIPGIAGDAQLTTDNRRAGNVHDSGEGNSVDFDSLGNPILQPGHVRSNAGEISVITMDNRGVVVRMGLQEYVVPYEVDSSGSIVFGEPKLLPNNERSMPDDPRFQNKSATEEVVEVPESEKAARGRKSSHEQLRNKIDAKLTPPDIHGERDFNTSIIATYDDFVVVEKWNEGKFYKIPFEVVDGEVKLGEPEQVEETFSPVKKTEKMAGDLINARRDAIAAIGKAVWSSAKIDELPDSAFAYVAPGGEKVDGKTKPRSLRHLPFKNAEGEVDAAHVRNALARLDQTDIPASAKDRARSKLEKAAEEVGIDVKEEDQKKRADKILRAAKSAVEGAAYCATCKKQVKLGEKKTSEKGAGGEHVTYKGECGHMIRRFEAAQKTDQENKGAETDKAEKSEVGVPTGMGEGAGVQPGNATGNPPPQNDPAEVQEKDILARLQAALGKFEAADAAQTPGGGDDEAGENRALAEIKSLVGALIAQQEREAVNVGDVGAHETQLSAKTVSAELIRTAAEEAVKAVLRSQAEKAAKEKDGQKGRKASIDEMRKRHGSLGALIDELDSDESPAEGHENDAGEKPDDEKKEATKAVNNAGGPSPVNRKEIAERITEETSAIQGLARIVAASEGELFHENEEVAGDLGPGQKPVAPTKKPAGETFDLAGKEGEPKEAGEDVRDMFKMALADVGKTVGEQLKETISPLLKRLEAVEHTARTTTAADLYVAEHPNQFGNSRPEVTKAVSDGLRDQFAAMSPKEQNEYAARLVAQARSAQR